MSYPQYTPQTGYYGNGYGVPQYQSPYMTSPYYQSAQEKYEQLLRQNPQIAQQMQPQPMPTQAAQSSSTLPIKATPVTSIEEAKAAQISLDNTLHIFRDTSNGNIYTKQFDLATGAASFIIYVPEAAAQDQQSQQSKIEEAEPAEEMPEQPNEIEDVKEELSQLYQTAASEITNLREDFTARMEEMSEELKEIKGAIYNVGTDGENDGTDESASKSNASAGKPNAKKRVDK